ncbi:MAG TPA: preprotein translocase subunit SecA [Thermoanaerobaculia bacterium]|nr:preprotein translocase subunit SecA [Thermoanaerobaculia bacterium]
MVQRMLTKVFGTKHDRDVKRLQPKVAEINALEPEIRALDDAGLRAKTEEFRRRLAEGATLDDLLVPAFAVVREAARRTLGMRHYDVQLIGGMVLHQGKIAEMRTGEGKTLVATLPVYLNSLAGKGVHVVTVNDYLARRDAEWMGQVYRFLGLSVGIIQHGLNDDERRAAYAADVSYITNNELGFDYLRDNMKFDLSAMVQRGHNFAIVDEVDSILIDEARTPLIISGPSEESVDKYYSIDRIIPKLERGEEIEERDGAKRTTGHFVVDEKSHSVALTEEGVARVEQLLGVDNLYDIENMDLLHGVNQGLRAHHLYRRDVEYLIKDGQVVIVDEFTGRMMPGRRWSDGLHQAVEAKEGVKIERENQTLATITFQNLFRMYDKLAGMTGTAATEATEFDHIYKLDVVVIPTHRPMIRQDNADVVYRTAREKWIAVVEEIQDCHERGQPVLVGTLSIEKSEMLSSLLKRKGVPHVVLNAKYHEREASIVAQAGRKGAVTIATNMAGRGTDILLGGNPDGLALAEADPETEAEDHAAALQRYRETCLREREEVLAAGGLHIVGTERHESRRIDNQLRGRSGRQGDPGSSRFFLSLEDDLMRIFVGSERIQGLLGKLGMEEGEAIEANMVSRAIERAQKQVEGRNFETRKHLLEYDDVMNKQREAIYRLRRDIFDGREGRDYVLRIAHDIVDSLVSIHCPEKTDPTEWTISELASDVLAYFDIDLHKAGIDLSKLGEEEIAEKLWSVVEGKYVEKEERNGAELMRLLERNVMLQFVDLAWKDHLLALDHLKEGIGLRGYGQRDPLQEYKKESYTLFEELKERIEDMVIRSLFRLEPVSEEHLERDRQRRVRDASAPSKMSFSAPQLSGPAAGPPPGQPASPFGSASTPPSAPSQPVRVEKTPGRNDPCWCGSGKKYKKCHGATAGVGA